MIAADEIDLDPEVAAAAAGGAPAGIGGHGSRLAPLESEGGTGASASPVSLRRADSASSCTSSSADSMAEGSSPR